MRTLHKRVGKHCHRQKSLRPIRRQLVRLFVAQKSPLEILIVVTETASRVPELRRCGGKPSLPAQSLPCAIRSDRGSRQDAIPYPSAHAAPRLRVCPSQRRPRHAGATGMARAQEHPAHDAL
jgi:hypothetical protein